MICFIAASLARGGAATDALLVPFNVAFDDTLAFVFGAVASSGCGAVSATSEGALPYKILKSVWKKKKSQVRR